MYTDLDAVNHLLSQVGAAPVTTLTPATPTVASALLRIEEAVRWVLKKGWWFNKYRIEAIPDGDGEITVQSTVIKAVAFHEFVIVKDTKLYAPRRNSFVFDMAFEVTITELFSFEDIPLSAQEAVLYRAAQQMVLLDLEDTNKAAVISEDFRDAWQLLKMEHLEIQRLNAAYLTPVQKMLGKVTPYRRYRTRNPNLPGGGL